MPVIAFASPKGGAGKTTAATVLVGELTHQGATVSVIDADPNRNLAHWWRLPGCPERVRMIDDVTEETILDRIDEAAAETPFVVIDLEGTASLSVAYAISLADLVIIPMQASQLDARQATRAIQLIQSQSRATRRPISYAVLLTRTNPALNTKTLRHLRSAMATANIPMLRTELVDREAFRAIFSFGGTVHDLTASDVGNAEKAIINARAMTAEIVDLLRKNEEAAS